MKNWAIQNKIKTKYVFEWLARSRVKSILRNYFTELSHFLKEIVSPLDWKNLQLIVPSSEYTTEQGALYVNICLSTEKML